MVQFSSNETSVTFEGFRCSRLRATSVPMSSCVDDGSPYHVEPCSYDLIQEVTEQLWQYEQQLHQHTALSVGHWLHSVLI